MRFFRVGLLLIFIFILIVFSPYGAGRFSLPKGCKLNLNLYKDIECYISSDSGVSKAKLSGINSDDKVIGFTFHSRSNLSTLINDLNVYIMRSYKIDNYNVYECSGAFGFAHCQIVEYANNMLRVGIPYIYDSF